MKYQQPYGVSDPNAPYVNGNPSTGTMGSIPPAASIEHPQREIANFITASGFTPSALDLVQLAKGIQSGRVCYGLDAGTPNQIAITLNPPLISYFAGLHLVIKMAYQNTNNVVINVNGLGPVPLVHTDLTNIAGAELKPGQMIVVVHDGLGHFQLVSGGVGGITLLTAPRVVYVNGTTGHDTNYDGSQPSVSGGAGPFRTIQKALATMVKYNLGGWSFTIYVADGTYSTNGVTNLPGQNGSGDVIIEGNAANRRAVTILNSGYGQAFSHSSAAAYTLRHLSFQTTANDPSGGNPAVGLWVRGTGAFCAVEDCAFGANPTGHLISDINATVRIGSTFEIYGSSAGAAVAAYTSGALMNYAVTEPNLLISAAVSLGMFAVADGNGVLWSQWNSITGAGNVLAGTKYVASNNGVISVAGRGINYLPGPTAGYTTSGGQYA